MDAHQPQRYPTTYRDERGEVATHIQNDGSTLTMVLRGVTYRGQSFDDFEPEAGNDPAPDTVSLNRRELCSCELRCSMPTSVVIESGARQPATLEMLLELGAATSRGGLDRERLALTLVVGRDRYESAGASGWFEDELLDLQRQLPAGTFLRSCINCALSDYSPCGHGLFGSLACFRGARERYRAVRSKQDLFDCWDGLTSFVQKTDVCPEFERRAPNTGYRG